MQWLAGDWPPAFGRKAFWTDYSWITEVGREYPDLDDCQILFPLPAAYSLVLTLTNDPSSYGVTLSLSHLSTPEVIQLGWDDQAHWHPHVLRWKELEAIWRCLAVCDPRLAHPGIPLLLLYRFAQVDADDDPTAVRATIATGWRSLSLFSESEIVQAVQHTDTHVIPRAGADRQWVWDVTHGWVNSGEEAYSLRQAHNQQFPFALFNGMLAEAERCATTGAK